MAKGGGGATSPPSTNLLRRLLFLCCGVLTGFLLPGLLRIDHSDSVVSVDDTVVVQGFAASNAGGSSSSSTASGIDNAAARTLTVQHQTEKGEVPSSQVSALKSGVMGNTLNMTQAIVSLWPRIIVLRFEEDSLVSSVCTRS